MAELADRHLDDNFIQREEYDLHAARGIGYATLARKLLQEIDPRLDVIWAKEGSKALQGGRWYIVRRNEDAPVTYWCVQNPDGSYADIGPEHIERMKAIDAAAHPGIYHRFRADEARRHRKNQKRREELHREFREKLDERIASMADPRIFVTPQMKARADGLMTSEGGVVLPAVAPEALDLTAPVSKSVQTGIAGLDDAPPEAVAHAIDAAHVDKTRVLADADIDRGEDLDGDQDDQ